MELLKKITPEEISPTLHIGREDSPELGTEGMQQLFDAHPNINSANANYNVEIQNRNNTAVQAHMDNTKNPHSVTKAQVGLGNVDNTTDLNKPVSIAQQNTLNTKADKVNTYTKAEVDTKLATKANTIDVNTKLATKADISYTDQKDADTLVSAKAYADQKVVDIGTGDMAMAVYDPWGRKGNVFEHIEDISIHTPALTSDKTIYVSPTGSDESGDGSKAKPYRSINFAHKHLPLNHGQYQVYIKCKNGMYDENIFISNHYNGLISISACESNPDVTVNSIWYEKCSDIAISDIKVKGFITSGWSQIYIGDCNKANIIRVKAETTDKTKTGIWTRNTLSTTIQLTTVSNKEVAFRCSQGNMCLAGIQGENNNIGYLTHGISDGLGGTISLGYGCSLTATVLIKERYGGRVFGESHKKNFKLKFNIDGIATTGECYYVEFDDLVYINAKVVVTSRDTSQADNIPVYLLGLPVVAPPDYQSNNSISSINGEFVGYKTHIGFVSLYNTAINIALSNVTGASIWATLGHIKVGTSIHINGFYLIKK